MSNLEKMIKYARNGAATNFKATFNDEISTRVVNKLDAMKQNIAQKLFKKEAD